MQLVYLAAAILGTGLLFILYVRYENRRFRVTEYDFYSGKVSRDITLAVMADLHNYSYGENNIALMEAIERSDPDYVVSAGDMVVGSIFAPGTKDTVRFLTEIVKRFRFIYGCGNHERKLLWDKDPRFKRVGSTFDLALKEAFDLLKKDMPERADSILPVDNRVLSFEEDNLRFYCLDLEKEYFSKTAMHLLKASHIDELVGGCDHECCSILIGHDPIHFQAYADWGADIVLAGHVHGGMIATPWKKGMISPRFTLFPKYDRGVFTLKDSTMFLSGGLGNHTVHIRINNRAELLVIRIHKDDGNRSKA